MIVIPSIDILDGRCVRLTHGDYAQETRYDVDPVNLAQHYATLGVGLLHVVDLDGAKAKHPVNVDLLQRIAAIKGLAVQSGGGIRSAEHLDSLLEVGISRVVIGSLAISQPDLVSSWLRRYGSERIVLALDVRVDDTGRALVCTDAWTRTTDKTLEQTIERFLPDGLVHLLCTDISRDGAMNGPSVPLYERLMHQFPEIDIQASGGVSGLHDLLRLKKAGLNAAITGKALLEGRITDEEIRAF